MIKARGVISPHNIDIDLAELYDSVGNLPAGEYEYLIFDKFKNRALPQLKYLCGVVLKTISDNLPNHPPVEALYRWFEQTFAPVRTCIIEGETFDYVDLKNERSSEISYVIDRIIDYASQKWQITIPDRDTMKAPEAKELYAEAYMDSWKRALSTISQNYNYEQ